MNLLDDGQSKTGTSGITGDMMDDLDRTAKWLRFIGIVGMIGSALLVLVFFVALFFMAGTNASGVYPEGGVYVVLFFMLLFFAGMGFLSLLLYRYGNNLRKYTQQREVRFLEEAIDNNKNIWIILGAFTIFSFFFIVLGLWAESSSSDF